ncbi:MAG: pyruvate kinase [Chloroflexi bacterium]|nr:pyruvate kinase [Chloroflexota bacterium]
MRFTKIVCTIGPASNEPEVIAHLIRAGMDVARINFSHGDHATQAAWIRRVRSVASEMDHPVAILGDLQGPKLRIGKLPEEGVWLETGQTVLLSQDATQSDAIPFQYPDLPRLVRPGDRMLLDDGLIELEVIKTSAQTIEARVILGGPLYSNKGVNLPRTDAHIPAITVKDKADLQFALRQGIDWIALSFVREAKDVLDLKGLVRRNSQSRPLPQIIAKIEKPEAVENIEAIIEVADGIMIARGDLGIELPAEDVPLVQKRIIHLCNRAGRPVITATQMLDSMIRNPRPTRAEASDVANAVLDGTDAVMLSGETAVGKYPVRAVETMARIIGKAESELPPHPEHEEIVARYNYAAQALAHAAGDLASRLGAAAIIAPTISGYTARQLSRYRPGIPVIAITPSPMVRRQLNLHWGVLPLFAPRRASTDDVIEDAVRVALDHDVVKEGDLVVVMAGAAGSAPGTANLLKVQLIEQVLARGIGVGSHKVRGSVRKLRPPIRHDLVIRPSDIIVAHALDSSWQNALASAGAFIVEEGGPHSHAAQLAEALNITALVGASGAFEALKEGDTVIVDPLRGIVYHGLSPDDVEHRSAGGRDA